MIEPLDLATEEQALLEAEAQLDAGHAIPLDDVVQWLKTWGTDNELPPPQWT